MEDVVVTVDKQQQRPRSRNGSPNNNSSRDRNGAADEEKISIICSGGSSSPVGKKNSITRSRGTSYNFSEDEQPLAPQSSAAASDVGESMGASRSRNTSFDFNISPVQITGNGSSKTFYRLPSPKQEIPPSAPPPEPKLTTLRSAIQKPEAVQDPDTSDDDDEEESKHISALVTAGGVEAPILVKAQAPFNRLKSKSRLAEPPPPPAVKPPSPSPAPPLQPDQPTMPRTPGRASVGAAEPAPEDDDPLKDVDLPEKYKRHSWGFWWVFQMVALVLLTGLLVCSCTVNVLERHSLWSLELWKWVLMALVLVSGRLLSGWVINVVVFFIERNFMWRKRVLYFVYGLRKGVQTALWITLALIAWLLLFDRKVERSTRSHKALTYITKVLVCFLLAAFIWLAKLLFVKVLASSYHVSTYFDRIQESLFSQYILETLSGPPLDDELQPETPVLQQAPTFKAGNNNKLKDPLLEKLPQMNQRNISAWNMKRLVALVKQSKISTLSQTLENTSEQEEGQENEIHTEWQARAAAKRVFKNVAKPGSKQIVLDDLLRFLPEHEARRALSLFEGAADTGAITKKILVNWVTNVYRERRSLALSLNDTKTAVDKLHHIINAITSIIIVIIWLLVLGLATSHLLVVVSSQLLLIVFVFGNTCKTVFEAIIFLFVMHPFDVGDRCVIDGVQLIVEEMNILTTVFLRYDNEKIYYPNSVLASKPISNFYRSPDMGDAIEFTVDVSTPIEKIAALKEKVSKHIASKSDHWHNKSTIIVKEIEDMNRMRMALWLQHTMNYQLAGERLIRKSELLLKLKSYFEELGIEYHLLPQEVTLTNR